MLKRNGMGRSNGNLSMRNYMNRKSNTNSPQYNNNSGRNFKILQEGDFGEEIEELQTMLLDLAHVYPTILIITIDGNFGSNTKTAVTQFQEVTGCECTGIVDEITWNKIKVTHSQKCKDVRITSILKSRINEDEYDESSNVIREGSTGRYVTDLQEYLNVISNKYPSIIKLKVDGIFGPKTKSAVFEFQKLFNLPIDGIVGQITWAKIYEVYKNIMDNTDISVNDLID